MKKIIPIIILLGVCIMCNSRTVSAASPYYAKGSTYVYSKKQTKPSLQKECVYKNSYIKSTKILGKKWCKVSYNGTTGYVLRKKLTKKKPKIILYKNYQYGYTKREAFIYTSYQKGRSLFGKVPMNSRIFITAHTSNGWKRVRIQKKTYYIKSRDISNIPSINLNKNIVTNPVVEDITTPSPVEKDREEDTTEVPVIESSPTPTIEPVETYTIGHFKNYTNNIYYSNKLSPEQVATMNSILGLLPDNVVDMFFVTNWNLFFVKDDIASMLGVTCEPGSVISGIITYNQKSLYIRADLVMNRKHTALHEFGHYYDFMGSNASFFSQCSQFSSLYNKYKEGYIFSDHPTNGAYLASTAQEFFASVFAEYCANPAYLQEHAPDMYTYLKNLITEARVDREIVYQRMFNMNSVNAQYDSLFDVIGIDYISQANQGLLQLPSRMKDYVLNKYRIYYTCQSISIILGYEEDICTNQKVVSSAIDNTINRIYIRGDYLLERTSEELQISSIRAYFLQMNKEAADYKSLQSLYLSHSHVAENVREFLVTIVMNYIQNPTEQIAETPDIAYWIQSYLCT